ncbi:MAG: LacI family DNA-binding transcriptional regulator [Pseudomonadota bacterium]
MTTPRLQLVEKPTVNDIARVAGVSLATVDRVLNERPGVRSVTIQKVQKAIEELGYVRDTAAANLARRRVYNLLFVLPAQDGEFIAALEAQIAQQATKLAAERTQIAIATAAPFDPQETVAILDRLSPDETDGVAVFAPETPSVRDAVKRLRDKGIAVVALVSDQPSSVRDHFVGIDNLAAGKTAAQLMGRFIRTPGEVLVLTGSRLARDHLERRQGFDLVMARDFPALNVTATAEGRDDPMLVGTILSRVLETHPDLQGIYASSASNAALVHALRQVKRARPLIVIAHELTSVSRAALADGTIDALITQDTGHLVRSAIRLLRATADSAPFNAGQERIRIDIYVKENLPPDTAG